MKNVGQRKTPPVKKATVKAAFQPIVLEGTLPYKVTILEDEYFVDYTPGLLNDLAAILVARKISDQLKLDIETFKKMKVKTSTADKKHMEGRYSKLIDSTFSLSTIADEILADALRQSQKKETK